MSDENELAKLYMLNRLLNNNFLRDYKIPKELLKDENILKLIYMFNWTKINKRNTYDLVYYHPFITVKDMKKAKFIKSRYVGNSATPAFLYCIFGLIFYRMINIKKTSLLFINTGHICLSVLLATGIFKLHYLKKLNEEMSTIPEFQNYLHLNVDIQKTIKELNNYNIKLI